MENAQVAVHLSYASTAGHALIDAELYLPRSWIGDPQRLAAAGVPDKVEFATKPELATQMITRALDAGVPASWVAGDEVYGASGSLRAELEHRRIGYVLAVGCDHHVNTDAGIFRADQITAMLPANAWQPMSAGDGAKGPRWYHWALLEITIDTDQPGCRWLLIRRNPSTGELAYYRAYAPTPVPPSALVTVAGRRWTIEESFQAGKGLCGLDEHQLRTWTSWRRWTIMSILAFAFLAAQACHNRSQPSPAEMIPLTCNEIRRLINIRTQPADWAHCLRWSTWRRRHQHTSRMCHYARRERDQP